MIPAFSVVLLLNTSSLQKNPVLLQLDLAKEGGNKDLREAEKCSGILWPLARHQKARGGPVPWKPPFPHPMAKWGERHTKWAFVFLHP